MRACCGLVLAVWHGYAAQIAAGSFSGFLHNLVKSTPSVEDVEEALAGNSTQEAEDAANQSSEPTESTESSRPGFFGSIASEARSVAHSLEHRAEDMVERAEHKAKEWKDEVKEDLDENWVELEEQNQLEGHSKAYNNNVVVALFSAVALTAAVGHLVECIVFRGALRAKGHPAGWVVGMLVASYAILIPAIKSVLFSFNIFMNLRMGSLGDMGYNITRHPVTESMLSVIGLLFRTGGRTGAFFVILYAMVLPALKIVLLVLGELWRGSDNPNLQAVSSICILLVQVTSKWATPDLFAYILLLFLFRHLDHPPLIRSEAVLDVGFECFGVFCLCSTFSTLAIHRPPLQRGASGLGGAKYTAVGQAARPALLHRLGRNNALLAVSVSTVAFAVLLLSGLLAPCMGLHLDTSILLKPKGPVPVNMKWALDDAIEVLDLKPMLHTEVSLWQCLNALGAYISQCEAASILAFTMLALFAVALTMADMIMLILATLALGTPGPNTAMAVSRVLKHISMLDVFCMGVFVVCLAGQAYRSVGFNLELRRGLMPLVGAEALHYITHYFVSSAVSVDEEGFSSDESSHLSEDKPLAHKLAIDEGL